MSRKKKPNSKTLRPATTAVAEKSPPPGARPPTSAPQRSPAPARSAAPIQTGLPLWIPAVLVLFTLLVYSDSFGGAFIYDDDQAVNKNTSIEHLWPPWIPLIPPGNLTVGGRPLLNLTFAINYAINGRSATWSYHILNFSVHALAGLALLGVLRRTFLLPVLRGKYGADALILAVAITLLWLINPLQTESVSYISQRAEALMGLFYLLTIYCFIRSTEEETPAARGPGQTFFYTLFRPRLWTARTWTILSIVSCSAGAAFKEIMISAPIMVLLFDRTFVAGTFLRAIKRRGMFYAGLALSWLVIAYGTLDIQGRVVGYDYGITGFDYALTETRMLVYYIYLMVWPHPLIIDYGTHIYRFFDSNWNMVYDDFFDCLPYALVVVVLFIATCVALVQWPIAGFIGAWFFLILAPTSSFFPIVVSPIGEHRLYLPLLTFLVPLVVALRYVKNNAFWISVIVAALLFAGGYYLYWGSYLAFLLPAIFVLRYIKGLELWAPVFALALLWSVLSYLRNSDYSTDVSLWAVTVSQEPDNARAHNNYGVTLLAANHAAEAAAQFQMATTIQPSYPDAHYNWGNATAQLGRFQEAIGHYQVALQQKPTMGSAQNNWGNALDAMGKEHEPEAIDHYLVAIQLDPNNAQFHYNLGHGYLVLKKYPDALEQFQEAEQLNPNMPDTHNTLGIIYYQMGDKQKALEEFQRALQLNPNLQPARDNLLKVESQLP